MSIPIDAAQLFENAADVQVFTAPGTWTWPGVNSQVRVLLVGGGGSVGVVQTPTRRNAGGAGGGGVIVRDIPVTSPLSVVVGAGAAAPSAPGLGGTSSVTGTSASASVDGGSRLDAPSDGGGGGGGVRLNTFSGSAGLDYAGTGGYGQPGATGMMQAQDVFNVGSPPSFANNHPFYGGGGGGAGGRAYLFQGGHGLYGYGGGGNGTSQPGANVDTRGLSLDGAGQSGLEPGDGSGFANTGGGASQVGTTSHSGFSGGSGIVIIGRWK